MRVAVPAGAAAIAGCAAVYYATYAVRSQWLGRTEWRGSARRATVALTFDDGPAEDTRRVLDTLAAHGVRATFFLIGRHVERYPAIARRIVDEGHEVGNHSYSHPIFLYTTPRRTRAELVRTQQVIADTTGVTPAWSRPPCGVRTPAYFAAARGLGLRTVQWSASGYDWQRRNASRIAGTALAQAHNGAIILLHDGDSAQRSSRAATVAALGHILTGLSTRGLRAEPLSDLLACAAGAPSHV